MPTIFFHVSPTVIRDSILAHGLDVSFMCERGIAGSLSPEADGTHLSETLSEARWYASFRVHHRVDVWQVDVSGLTAREVNDGWICPDVIDPSRLTLLGRSISPDDALERRGAVNESDVTGSVMIARKELPRSDLH